MKKEKIQINGMHCAGCAGKVNAALGRLPGVKDVKTDKTSATISYDEKQVTHEAIVEEILSIGYEVPV